MPLPPCFFGEKDIVKETLCSLKGLSKFVTPGLPKMRDPSEGSVTAYLASLLHLSRKISHEDLTVAVVRLMCVGSWEVCKVFIFLSLLLLMVKVWIMLLSHCLEDTWMEDTIFNSVFLC